MNKTQKLISLLEKYINRKIVLKEKSDLPSFLSYNNLFNKNDDQVINEEEDGDVITKPKTKPPVTKPKPKKRPSPLTPTRPVVQPKPKSLHEEDDDEII